MTLEVINFTHTKALHNSACFMIYILSLKSLKMWIIFHSCMDVNIGVLCCCNTYCSTFYPASPQCEQF